jgi:hypothetical protein
MSEGAGKVESARKRERVSLRRVLGYALAPVRARPGLSGALLAGCLLLFVGRVLAASVIWPGIDWTALGPDSDQARLFVRISRGLVNALAAAFFLQLSLSVWREVEDRPVGWLPALSALPAAIAAEFVRDMFSLGLAGFIVTAGSAGATLAGVGLLFSGLWQIGLTAFLGMTVPVALDRRGGLVAAVSASLALSRGRRWLIAGLTLGLTILLLLLNLPLIPLFGLATGPAPMSASAGLGAVAVMLQALALGGLYRELREIEGRERLEAFD